MLSRRLFTIAAIAMLISALGICRTQAADGIPRVAYVANKKNIEYRLEAFHAGLSDFGYIPGENIEIEFFLFDRFDELPHIIPKVIESAPDIIVSFYTPTTLALKAATSTIPVVMVAIADPVGSGIVPSLAQPGGNVTGATLLYADLMARRLQLLIQVVPAASRFVTFHNPHNEAGRAQLTQLRAAARSLGVTVDAFEARGADDWTEMLAGLDRDTVDGLVFVADNTYFSNHAQIAKATLNFGFPAIFPDREYVEAGGLMSYGVNVLAHIRRAPYFVHRILAGAAPSELPVEQPKEFDFVINLEAQERLGVEFSNRILAVATEVIE